MIIALLILASAFIAHLRGFVLDRSTDKRGRPDITLPPEQPTRIIPSFYVADPRRALRH